MTMANLHETPIKAHRATCASFVGVYSMLLLAVFLRNRVAAFWALVFPLFLLVALHATFGASTPKLGPVAVRFVDNDHTDLSRRYYNAVTQALISTASLSVVVDAGSARQADRVTLTVPKGFSERLVATGAASVQVDKVGSSTMALDVVVQIANAISDRFVLLEIAKVGGVSLRESAAAPGEHQAISYTQYLVTGLVCLTALSTSLFGFAVTLVLLRESGTFAYFSILPTQKLCVLVALVVSRSAVILASVLTLAAVGVMLGARLPADVASTLAAVIVIVAGCSAFLMVGLAVASATDSPDGATVICNLIYFPAIFFGNLFIPLGPAQPFLQWLPPNLFAEALRKAVDGRSSDLEVPIFLLQSAGLCVLCMLYAKRKFLWNRRAATYRSA